MTLREPLSCTSTRLSRYCKTTVSTSGGRWIWKEEETDLLEFGLGLRHCGRVVERTSWWLRCEGEAAVCDCTLEVRREKMSVLGTCRAAFPRFTHFAAPSSSSITFT